MTTTNLLIDSPSSIETDWSCGMKWWWQKFEGGTGVVPVVEEGYLGVGKDIHAAVAEVVSGKPLDLVLAGFPAPADGAGQVAWEEWARLQGWIIAFHHYEWPRLLTTHTLLGSETELVLRRGLLRERIRPDLLLLEKDSGLGVYKEFKSTSMSTPSWALHWRYAVQIHLGLLAAEEWFKIPFKSAQVIGLWKGREDRGKLHHPYVWAYSKGGELSNWYKSGWDLIPSWQSSGGMVTWVEKMGSVAADMVFPHSEPIFLDPRQVDRLINRRIMRMTEVSQVKEACQTDPDLRALHFEQKFSTCKPVWGGPCPYLAACFNQTVGEDPVGSGLYKVRPPNPSTIPELNLDRVEE